MARAWHAATSWNACFQPSASGSALSFVTVVEIWRFIVKSEARAEDDAWEISLCVEKFPVSAVLTAAAPSSRSPESSSIAFFAWVEAGAGGVPSPFRLSMRMSFADVIASEALAKSA